MKNIDNRKISILLSTMLLLSCGPNSKLDQQPTTITNPNAANVVIPSSLNENEKLKNEVIIPSGATNNDQLKNDILIPSAATNNDQLKNDILIPSGGTADIPDIEDVPAAVAAPAKSDEKDKILIPSGATGNPQEEFPLAASLEIGGLESNSFSINQFFKKLNATRAIITTTWVEVITAALLAGPIIVVNKSLDQNADCKKTDGDWLCNWDEVNITNKLRAKVTGTKAKDEKPNFTFTFNGSTPENNEISEYIGMTCTDCSRTTGLWTAHDLNAKEEALTLRYQITGDGDKEFEPDDGESSDLTLTLKKDIGELPTGSSVRYIVNGNQRKLVVINGKTSERTEVEWDKDTEAGKISKQDAPDAEPEAGCWDEKGFDVDCPETSKD